MAESDRLLLENRARIEALEQALEERDQQVRGLLAVIARLSRVLEAQVDSPSSRSHIEARHFVQPERLSRADRAPQNPQQALPARAVGLGAQTHRPRTAPHLPAAAHLRNVDLGAPRCPTGACAPPAASSPPGRTTARPSSAKPNGRPAHLPSRPMRPPAPKSCPLFINESILALIAEVVPMDAFRLMLCAALVCRAWRRVFEPRMRGLESRLSARIHELRAVPFVERILIARARHAELARSLFGIGQFAAAAGSHAGTGQFSDEALCRLCTMQRARYELAAVASLLVLLNEPGWEEAIDGRSAGPVDVNEDLLARVRASLLHVSTDGGAQRVTLCQRLMSFDVRSLSQPRAVSLARFAQSDWFAPDFFQLFPNLASPIVAFVRAVLADVPLVLLELPKASADALDETARIAQLRATIAARRAHVAAYPFVCPYTRVRFQKASELSRHKSMLTEQQKARPVGLKPASTANGFVAARRTASRIAPASRLPGTAF